MKPERWQVDAGSAAQARLDVPADAARERWFEIAVSMSARTPGAGAPWHELRVEADGRLLWSRRIASHVGDGIDGLDYRFRRSVPVGRPLRVLARVECGGGAQRWRLRIEADET